MNKTAVKQLIIKMLIYSAMKIRANVPLLNSVLNPETSSDSPSAKSKGVRLVSAKVEISQIALRGAISSNAGTRIEAVMCEKSKDSGNKRAVISRSLILTS